MRNVQQAERDDQIEFREEVHATFKTDPDVNEPMSVKQIQHVQAYEPRPSDPLAVKKARTPNRPSANRSRSRTPQGESERDDVSATLNHFYLKEAAHNHQFAK